jgi:release factor glutamine methyltransferase
VHIKEFIHSVSEQLTPLYPKEEGRALAIRLLEHYCGLPPYQYIIEPEQELEQESLPTLEKAVKDLSLARPLQYILGYQEFLGRRFAVREGVLIPRPETEEMVIWLLEEYRSRAGEKGMEYEGGMSNKGNPPGLRILDAACGSGCIGITLACELTESFVYMCDLSDEAIKISMTNSEGKNLSGRIEIFREDLLCLFPCRERITDASLDIIVSNPPYVLASEKAGIRRNVLEYEPDMALFVPDDDPLLFYKQLAVMGKSLLVKGGKIYFEINEKFGSQVKMLLHGIGYRDIEIKRDFCGKDRVIRGVWNI